MVRIALVGAGAFGEKHLVGLRNVPDAEVVTVVSASEEESRKLAEPHGVSDVSDNYAATLARNDIDAVILTTPTPLHARQAIMAMDAGKHVEVEIPVADSWADAQAVMAKQQETGLVCMVGHTRRFNPSHQFVKKLIDAGEFTIQAMDIETFFFRRRNMNAKGEPRSWTDHLLWHHSAHSIDIFQYMTGSKVIASNVLQGPKHRELGIAMDMSIQLKTEAGQILTLALSFNNDGPLGTFFRYIGDTGTYIARYDDLVTGREEPVDLSGLASSSNGIELQDREFVAAIKQGREPNSSVGQVFECYRVLGELAASLETQDGWS
ncbi:4-carboxy-2-hydroxymuconate-6-semialdehyde dehydrogenase [Tsuneonella dongtanensis]|uniref:4-carboxy-2-hydroxymuconate-6-semialdehyde dehydrogenase n=1 Tax=Tsuneonella dongtanensis TaxID=692370 RepID=A0A1B2ABT3_9SPHN|nr:Gfo/Idh/MocA family oxidoreductase [Tsuneonella dongtanensis]ANY19597.1 4-carboxy-2-hydroxymuconate-6-semialdehyde dehydrogenase [Tsuneonella dongtanensis]